MALIRFICEDCTADVELESSSQSADELIDAQLCPDCATTRWWNDEMNKERRCFDCTEPLTSDELGSCSYCAAKFAYHEEDAYPF